MILLVLGIMLVLWNIILVPIRLWKRQGILINLTCIGVGCVLTGLCFYGMTQFTSMD